MSVIGDCIVANFKPQMKDVVVRYFHHPNTGKGIGCVVAVRTPDGIKIGWSQCNPMDNFSRKAARNIAIQRAVKPPTEPLKQASVKFKLYRPAENPFLPVRVQTITVTHPLDALIEVVGSIANRAFAPKPPSTDLTFEDLKGIPFEPRPFGALPPNSDTVKFLYDQDGDILGTIKDGVFEPLGPSGCPAPSVEEGSITEPLPIVYTKESD
jgi:hypothetical protein